MANRTGRDVLDEWYGYYRCPCCGSTETYSSNLPTKSGGGFVGTSVADSGAFIGANIGGYDTMRTVTRCKKCKEILGWNNRIKGTSDYLTAEKEKLETTRGWLILPTFILAGFFVVGAMTASAAGNSNTAKYVCLTIAGLLICLGVPVFTFFTNKIRPIEAKLKAGEAKLAAWQP